MMQTDHNSLFFNDSKRMAWSSFSPKGKRRLVLWAISALLLFIATSVLQNSIQHESPLGVIFGGSWIAAILVNSAIVDYLLRQSI